MCAIKEHVTHGQCLLVSARCFLFCTFTHAVKSSHLYLYSAFNNTNCVKATAQYQNSVNDK